MTKVVASALAAVLALAALSSCGTKEQAGRGAAPAESAPASTPAPTTTRMRPVPGSPNGPREDGSVPPTVTPRQGTVRVAGTVSDGVESGCTLLTSNGVVYQLIWRHGTVAITSKMEVEGTVQPDLMTTCQQGTPLVVDRVISP